MKIFVYFIVLFFMAIACIPIEDRLMPISEKVILNSSQKEYGVQDTVKVSVKYRDNQKLDCL